jgi:hypothetical protein
VDDLTEVEIPLTDDDDLDDDDERADDGEITGVGEPNNGVTQQMDARYGARGARYALRPRKERSYSHLFATSNVDTNEEPLATSQMSMKQGIKLVGEEGVAAVKTELRQLHDRQVIKPNPSTELTREQKRAALAYLMFMKRKRCGRLKGRGCADGRKQRKFTAREDAALPTVSTEAIFLTAVIDAFEKRDVAIIDLPGAFMQADMDEQVHVRFVGTIVDLLLEIDPDMYGPCVVMERGQRVIYVELLKALYGTVRAARLFWEKQQNFCRRVFDKHTSFSTWRLVRFLRDLRVHQNQ